MGHVKADIDIGFMVPGFSKCGTTTLCTLLDAHPDIAMSSNKEPNFFLRNDCEQHWDIYTQLFPGSSNNLICGEGSTFYSTRKHEKDSRDNILKHFPEIKLIFMARDPLRRIESSFREFHHSGNMFALNAEFDIDRALKQLPQLIDDSMFYARLNNYLARMPKQRILVLFLEDLIANTEFELRRCFNFLSVDPEPATAIKLLAMNAGEEKLYDSKLLRRLRVHPYWGWRIAKLTLAQQDGVFKRMGLRRKFTRQIQWTTESLETIANALTADTEAFLQMTGKDANCWPYFAEISKLYYRPAKN
jgi:sulfotransferase family protein